MKYAHYDEEFNLLGWYDKDINIDIPTPNIEVTDAQWKSAINNKANFIDIKNKEVIFKDNRNSDEILLELQNRIIYNFNNTIIYKLTIGGNVYSTRREDILKYREATDTAELLGTKVDLLTLNDIKVNLTINEARNIIKQLAEKSYNDYWKVKSLELNVRAIKDIQSLYELGAANE